MRVRATTSRTGGHASFKALLPAIGKLLRLRWLISVNSFRHSKTINKVLTVLGLLALLGVAGVIFWLSWLLLGFLRSPALKQVVGMDPTPFLQAVPVLIFTGLFLGILLLSFGLLLQALYLAGDMDFLLSSPVPIRAVFVAKLLQAVLPNFGLFALFGLPVLLGLGAAGGYNLLYYPLVPLIMVALTLAGAGISALLVMLVVRVLPPRRAAEILGFIGGTLGLICSQLGNLYNAFGRNADISETQAVGVVSTLMRLNVPWLPLNWAGRGLVALGEGRWLTGILLVGLTLGLSATLFGFALVTAERWYYSGWARMQVIARRKPVRTARQVTAGKAEPVFWAARLLPAPMRGIVWKDFLVLRRDLRIMSQLISPLIFGLLYSLMIFRMRGEPPGGRGEAPAWFMDSLRTLLSYGSVGMSLFVGWMLLGRLAGMGFSQEGKNYWMLKASPVRIGHLLAAKFLVAYLPALALGMFFLVGISLLQRVPLATFLYSLPAVAMCLAGMTGIQLGFGAAGANLKWEDPRRMNAGSLGCLGQFLTMLYIPLAFGAFIGPLWLVPLLSLPPVLGYLVGLVLGTAVSGVCAFLPLWLVRGRVSRLDEA
jgi:ABC-2 type transport system permease protein